MGVQNLWVLLAPVGRQIEIESLAGQVLAVDASIWLTQFVKAMRDDEGNMIRNAHLMGTLHRVSKLLYYGVRPVFVFDGQTPEIKKRTTARRKKRQEQQSANLRHTAQRILLNRLKQTRQEMKKNKGAPVSAVAPGFTLPEVSNTTKEEEKAEMEIEFKGEEVERKSAAGSEGKKSEENSMQMVWEAADEDEEQLTVDNIELDSSRLSKIDLHAVFSLPPHLQKDMLNKIQRDRRQEVRNKFIPLAGNPEKYSHTQISAFLQTSALNRRIEAAKRQKREEEMNHQGGVGQGHRINSNSNRFYIYEKDSEQKEEKDEESDDMMAGAKCTSAVEVMQPYEKGDGVFELLEKRSPSEKNGFALKADGAEVTAAWVARHHVRIKQEPVLAIEKLRQERLKIDGPILSVKPSQCNVSASQKPDNLINSKGLAHLQTLLPMSVPEIVSSVVDDDKNNGVHWEEVVAPATEQASLSSLHPEFAEHNMLEQNFKSMVKSHDTSDLYTKVVSNASPETLESDEEMEWEDVPRAPVDLASNNTSGLEQVITEKKSDSLNPLMNALEEHRINFEDKDEERSDELFLTLKNEMEDAKAHEDLDLLKADALRSAMMTASNLTQWAAGAVRRALKAHSLQHSNSVEINASRDEQAESRVKPQPDLTEGSANPPLEIADEEDRSKLDSTDIKKSFEANAMVDKNDDLLNENIAQPDTKDNYEQLQAALAASIGDEQETENAESTRVRYLQYSQSSEIRQPKGANELEMDTEALQKEQLELKKLRNRQLRDTEGITDDMVAEVMVLLRLFGVPFLVSPMEAEAQCAALEQLGLVDGVITDDSDIFPFGGQRVYKNIFHHQKFVEAFSACDIEQELGFSREQIIALALLLGSDYTDGVRGIGIVNATEIAAAYPGIEGLRDFKEWVRDFNVAEEAQRVVSGGLKKKRKSTKDKNETVHDSNSSGEESARTRFQRAHATARRKWELGDEFPSKQVVQAYMAPQVDRSDARFSWTAPDVKALRDYCVNAFGWDQQKSDGVLKPLEEKARAALVNGSRHIQTRLDRFFTSYKDQVHYAQIKSKRLRSAVHQGTGSKKRKGKERTVE